MDFIFEVTIAAPVEDVFRVATDLEGAPETISGITKLELLTPGPVGAGTRFRETRVMFGKEAVEEMEVTEFDPPRGYTVCAENHGARYRTVFEVSEAGDGTKLRMHFQAVPITFGAKVMSILCRPLMGAVKKEMKKDLTDIKAALESK